LWADGYLWRSSSMQADGYLWRSSSMQADSIGSLNDDE
jgi:hypothetical protein